MTPLIQQLPRDSAEQLTLARKLAKAALIPKAVRERTPEIAADKRVRFAFPRGAERGALEALRLAAGNDHRLPRGVRGPRDETAKAWAAGITAGLPLPPRAAFSSSKRLQIGAAIYRAGFASGFLHTLEQIGLRGEGGS